ncbi:hypothetical protein EVAR_21622_1 [Eumeta japonica]|uniref:Uncharacterized protein n=1 Tax=Eumeta variegata TaxID=151549 RepID=A0A4C1UZF6_EUMVA|nr:hypothetical protein EVAR_21622_1 [Eumeta japonica]
MDSGSLCRPGFSTYFEEYNYSEIGGYEEGIGIFESDMVAVLRNNVIGQRLTSARSVAVEFGPKTYRRRRKLPGWKGDREGKAKDARPRRAAFGNLTTSLYVGCSPRPVRGKAADASLMWRGRSRAAAPPGAKAYRLPAVGGGPTKRRDASINYIKGGTEEIGLFFGRILNYTVVVAGARRRTGRRGAGGRRAQFTSRDYRRPLTVRILHRTVRAAPAARPPPSS